MKTRRQLHTVKWQYYCSPHDGFSRTMSSRLIYSKLNEKTTFDICFPRTVEICVAILRKYTKTTAQLVCADCRLTVRARQPVRSLPSVNLLWWMRRIQSAGDATSCQPHCCYIWHLRDRSSSTLADKRAIWFVLWARARARFPTATPFKYIHANETNGEKGWKTFPSIQFLRF